MFCAALLRPTNRYQASNLSRQGPKAEAHALPTGLVVQGFAETRTIPRARNPTLTSARAMVFGFAPVSVCGAPTAAELTRVDLITQKHGKYQERTEFGVPNGVGYS